MPTSPEPAGPRPPQPEWRRWGARIGLGVALAAAAWLAFRSLATTRTVRVVYLVGDESAGLAELDIAWLDGDRAVRAKTWNFAPDRPAPRALEDTLELRPGTYRVELDWTGSAGPRSATVPVTVGDDPPTAPIVIPLEAAPPGGPK